MFRYIRFFKEISLSDIPEVGGKNASLGEMYQHLKPKGVNLPNGFATTAQSYYYFLDSAGLTDTIKKILQNVNVRNLSELHKAGSKVRSLILAARFPNDLTDEIISGYHKLSQECGKTDLVVAVRSSATAEDLPNASFAGQQETYLNISGQEELITAVKNCIASLFTDRAIVYRVENGFEHMKVALSVGVQQMVAVRSKASGVMFTLDTESGSPNVSVITSIYGIGENIVKGRVSPDEFMVFKPTLAIIKRRVGSKKKKLIPTSGAHKTKNIDVSKYDQERFSITDQQVQVLAKWGNEIEQYYQRPMDVEWALDEDDDTLYVVQARGETVQSQKTAGYFETYKLGERSEILATGVSVGNKIGSGKASKIAGPREIARFKPGSVLVTEMTDPDWVPVMKLASAIVTNRGGRTCHAAIVSRELGIPCVVGAGNATQKIAHDQPITVSCAEGDEGVVFDGELDFTVQKTDASKIKRPQTKIMMNVGAPELAFQYANIPNDGVGLAREEFIINAHVKVHPLALLQYEQITDKKVKRAIKELTQGFATKADYFVQQLAEGIGAIGAAFYPKDVIIRFSDFKTNEYANLIGGKQFEPLEDNPMLGWRGASRYYAPEFQQAFELECMAFKKARNEWGLTNIKAMVPFCRTIEEAKKVLAIMASQGLKQGNKNFEAYMMVEVPSNVILAEQFAKLFDGFSIGSNDLTQLTLGVDRDNSMVAPLYNENNEAVRELIRQVISIAKKHNVKIGLCGQAPSDSPEFARFLVECGIDSMSLSPDTIVQTTIDVQKTEKKLHG